MRAEQLATAASKLESEDVAVIEKAFSTLGELGGEPAANLLIARVRRGLPPQLTELAIDTLVLIGKPSAGPVLLELTLHRREPIRERAVTALGALQIRNAQSALLYALDDPSAAVRAATVQALAAVGDARALPALYVAADRGVDNALRAVGELATPREVVGLVARGKDDVTPIKPALAAMLERPKFPLAGKLRVVAELTKLGSPSARACLVEWLEVWKVTGHPRLRKALFDGVQRIDRERDAAAAKAATAAAKAEAAATASSKPTPDPKKPQALQQSRASKASTSKSQNASKQPAGSPSSQAAPAKPPAPAAAASPSPASPSPASPSPASPSPASPSPASQGGQP